MEDHIIQNVRQQSNAGWFIGGLCFTEDNAVCWDKDDTGYFLTEEELQYVYPNSISFKQACNKAKLRRWINWDI